jgi:hypothetical protein
LQTNATLQQLDLASDIIGNEGAAIIASALETNESLLELETTRNPTKPVSYTKVVSKLSTLLRSM